MAQELASMERRLTILADELSHYEMQARVDRRFIETQAGEPLTVRELGEDATTESETV